MNSAGRTVSRGTLVLVWLLCLALLIDHVLRLHHFELDSSTLVVLGVLVVLAHFQRIRRLSFSGFEAEIAPEEVAQVRAKAAELHPIDAPTAKPSDTEPLVDVTRRDPQLGLAMLRIELEELLRALNRLVSLEDKPRRRVGLGRLVDELAREGAIPSDVAATIRDILPLANRAIHGEQIRVHDAEALALAGEQVLDQLRSLYQLRVGQPIDSTPIDQETVEQYMLSRFRVQTVVPLVERPVLNTYVFDQPAFTEFLTGYEEYGEFLIDVEAVGPGNAESKGAASRT